MFLVNSYMWYVTYIVSFIRKPEVAIAIYKNNYMLISLMDYSY